MTTQVEGVDCSTNHDPQTSSGGTQWSDGRIPCYCQVKDYNHMTDPHVLSTDTARQEEPSYYLAEMKGPTWSLTLPGVGTAGVRGRSRSLGSSLHLC